MNKRISIFLYLSRSRVGSVYGAWIVIGFSTLYNIGGGENSGR